ncbi:LysR family transcriptional regulator [Litoreibacter roseus]|uniref:LysR family transcriptional regulator n=1 Tax=Litoreibacter roseus TaxID=2601869 RepID=A0A6N6JLV1_9RHOB|nr:LysR family transcriptional regulator [Litoreibacter roseus]GFE66947.1 LysR family transcriptional regulator [Litoreibacter roseus]
MNQLNYHHLRYFREVAVEGHLGRAADRLNLSQSALSIQIRTLEDRLGYPLFDRVGRTLVLTAAGRIALDHADRIFSVGEDLLASLQQNAAARPPLRVGALSTLSRNFQLQFLRPLLASDACRIVLRSGNTKTLLKDLEMFALDVVLTTEVPQTGLTSTFAAQRITEQSVGIHGSPARMGHRSLKSMLANEPLILPTESVIRAGFENLVAKLDIRPRIAAYVDDMAMVRLLAREDAGLAIAPSVVLADEIASGRVTTAPFDLDITEPFYAVTVSREFPHEELKNLLP